MEAIESPAKPKASLLPSKFWLILITAIPAYTYFFGYTFFRSKMNHLGFEVSFSNINSYEIFYQAYKGISIGLAKGLVYFTDAIINNLIVTLCITPIIFALCLGLMYIIEKISLGHPGSIYQNIRRKLKEKILAWQLSRKGKLINISLFVVVLLGIQLLFSLIPFILTIFWMYLFVPEAIGTRAAFEEINNFSCEPNFDKNHTYFVSCSTITLKNKNQYIGAIIHGDDKNLYLLNKTESRIIPISDIEENKRTITKRPNKLNEASITTQSSDKAKQ